MTFLRHHEGRCLTYFSSAPKVCISLHICRSILTVGRMNLFYSNSIVDNKISLKDQEAHHCSRVLRKEPGDEIHVTDGRGSRFLGKIDQVKKDEVLLEIVDQQFSPMPATFPHVAFGIIKTNTRMEFLLEKITEIGVARITPLICDRCERKKIRRERLRKVLVSAMKQSLKDHLPIIDEAELFYNFIEKHHHGKQFIASYGEGITELKTLRPFGDHPLIMIGPEGDFSRNEIMGALRNGFERVNLGTSRLRAETAAIMSAAILNN